MDLKVGVSAHGFEITRIRKVEELDATMVEMLHLKTGAQLIWMKSEEKNKLFSIAFRTLPEDDTGVFHILEHSVLCGSDKFPVKEPFVELLKSSLNTFLNAMTYPDKTMYPVSSRNEADFLNLTEIYLDAVFKPALHTNPNIFYQEGWHYEFDESGKPVYKGVVFNEMKGATSSVFRVLMSGMDKTLYPDNCYRYNSGGEPASIPDLTYEQFVASHKKYYHPSNSLIYLDGDLPIDKTLALIDGDYLSHYEKSDRKIEFTRQKPIKSAELTQYYEISAEEDEKNKTHIAYGKIMCGHEDQEKIIAAQILADCIAGSNDAPLKKSVLSSGLAQDIDLYVMDGIDQPYVLTHISNTDYESRDAVKTAIRDCVKGLVEGGLNRTDLEASMNRIEFRFREVSEPKGLINNDLALNSWLYGDDPITYLTYNKVFEDLRAKLDTKYYHELLAELLLDETGVATVYTLPSKTLGNEKREKEAARIAAAEEKWSAEEKAVLVERHAKLEKWQQTPDSEQALGMMPKLSLSEVGPLPVEIKTEVSEKNGVTALFHPSNAKGITYINLYFNVSDKSDKSLQAYTLLGNMLTELSTKRSASELQRDIKTNIGELTFALDITSKQGEIDCCTPRFVARCSVLDHNYDAAVRIIKEVLTETVFTEENKLKELLLQQDEGMKQRIIMAGHQIAIFAAAANFSSTAALRNKTDGFGYYEWLHAFAKDFDAVKKEFIAAAEDLKSTAFCKERLIVSISAEKNIDPTGLIESFPSGKGCPATKKVELSNNKATGIKIPANICYSSFGANLYGLGSEYTGVATVLAHLVSYSFLWNEVRVQGGAYGAGMRSAESGDIMFYSYRDPNCKRSIDIFKRSSEFVKQYCESDPDLEACIIGSISDTEPLRAAKDSANMGDRDYLCGITYATRCEIRDRMRNLKKEELLALVSVLDKIAADGAYCVVGFGDALDKLGDENLVQLGI